MKLLLFILCVLYPTLYFFGPEVQRERWLSWWEVKSGRALSWHDVQSKRKEMVAQVCRKYKEIKLQPFDYERFHYSSEYNLMFCTSPKAGSTTYFLTTFAQIIEGEDWTEEEIPEGQNMKI